ncbi:MAG: P-loop NTPase [Nanobdellota archaeon]
MVKTILVMSGKGGVGKTTVSAFLAQGLAQIGEKTGVLDVDVHGPDTARLFGVSEQKLRTEHNKIKPVTVSRNISLVSISFMTDKEESIVWRGPMKHNLIKQFTQDIAWDDITYKVIDFPPGTGDECISTAQLLKDKISGVIIVSTPQQVSIDDSLRAINFAKKMKLPIIGLVENMSGEIFGQDTLKSVALEKNIPFLASIPLDKRIISWSTQQSTKESNEFIHNISNELAQKTIKNLK